MKSLAPSSRHQVYLNTEVWGWQVEDVLLTCAAGHRVIKYRVSSEAEASGGCSVLMLLPRAAEVGQPAASKSNRLWSVHLAKFKSSGGILAAKEAVGLSSEFKTWGQSFWWWNLCGEHLTVPEVLICKKYLLPLLLQSSWINKWQLRASASLAQTKTSQSSSLPQPFSLLNNLTGLSFKIDPGTKHFSQSKLRGLPSWPNPISHRDYPSGLQNSPFRGCTWPCLCDSPLPSGCPRLHAYSPPLETPNPVLPLCLCVASSFGRFFFVNHAVSSFLFKGTLVWDALSDLLQWKHTLLPSGRSSSSLVLTEPSPSMVLTAPGCCSPSVVLLAVCGAHLAGALLPLRGLTATGPPTPPCCSLSRGAPPPPWYSSPSVMLLPLHGLTATGPPTPPLCSLSWGTPPPPWCSSPSVMLLLPGAGPPPPWCSLRRVAPPPPGCSSSSVVLTAPGCSSPSEVLLPLRGAHQRAWLPSLGQNLRMAGAGFCSAVAHRLPQWFSYRKSPACQCRRHRFNPGSGGFPWRRKWQLTPVFLPGRSHGQRCTAVHTEPDTTEPAQRLEQFMALYKHFQTPGGKNLQNCSSLLPVKTVGPSAERCKRG